MVGSQGNKGTELVHAELAKATSVERLAVERGDILAGKFRVEEILSERGMGVIVAATHLGLDKEVAIKFLRESSGPDEEESLRFLREARATAQLRNEHVVRVLDLGRFDSGEPYMVMERLRGADLEALMADRLETGAGPFSPERASDYVLQACVGMAEAHAQGFVHRDLKPSNLFLCPDLYGVPRVKILDFGIAKADVDLLTTKTQAVMGSPSYMPPEQWAGAKHVDERGDIWALGASLYFLLSGSSPFTGDSMPALFAAISEGTPAPLEESLPEGMGQLIERCLSAAVEERPQDLGELAEALVAYASPESQALPSRARYLLEGTPIGETVSVANVTRRAVTVEASASLPRQRPSWLTSVGIAGIAVAGTLLVTQLGGSTAKPLAAPSTPPAAPAPSHAAATATGPDASVRPEAEDNSELASLDEEQPAAEPSAPVQEGAVESARRHSRAKKRLKPATKPEEATAPSTEPTSLFGDLEGQF